MSPLFACILAGAVFVVLRDAGWRRTGPIAVAIGALVIFPVPTLLVIGALGVLRLRGRLKNLRPSSPAADDLPLLVDLTGLGLSAGMTFPAAVGAGADQVDGSLAGEVRRTLRGRTSGARGASAPVGVTSRLFSVVDRALVTGAPMLPAVTGYAAALRSEERHRRVAAARRLPVKLLFPLALLILPGFLLLTIGPAFLAGLERMGL